MTQPAPASFGKYRILERIASGGMAEIFKARLDGIGGFHRTFAIKRILPGLSRNPEFVDLLVDEAKVAGLLSHANIVQILDLGNIDDHYFIAMEFVSGHDLGKVMKRCLEKGITLPVPHAVFICIEVLKGLEYAHNRQVMRDGRPVPLDIVHRDISPSNILISKQGEVKITDFGMSKASIKALETVDGVVKGRFDYLTPEQADGRTASQQSDLFSLGIVFYEMLVGDHPFRKDTDMATLEAVRSSSFEPASFVNMDIPPQLDDVISRALTLDPKERYPTPTAFKEELDRFFHESEFIFTQSTLAAFLKGLFPEQKARRNKAQRTDAPTRPLDRPTGGLAANAPPPIDDFDEDILPTVVKENPLSRVSPFKPKAPRPTAAPSPAASIHEAATMLRRIPDPNAVGSFGGQVGLSEAATLIRANPLLDGGDMGELDTQIKRKPAYSFPAEPVEDPAAAPAFGITAEEQDSAFLDRPTLARADLERPTVAGEPVIDDLDLASEEAPRVAPRPPPAAERYHQPPAPPTQRSYPPPAERPGPAPPISAPPPRRSTRAPVPAAPVQTPVAPTQPGRIPLRSHLAYLAGALFTLILGLLLGCLVGFVVSSALSDPELAAPAPSGPGTLQLSVPAGARLLLDGREQQGGPAYELELEPGSEHQLRVEHEQLKSIELSVQLDPGETRTVVLGQQVMEPKEP